MNPKSNMYTFTRVNTLYSIQQICNAKGFQTGQHNVFTAQFKASLLALKEEVKFLSFIGYSKLPDGMETIGTNLIQSTMLDNEVISNQGNQYTVIDSLWAALQPVDTGLLDSSDVAIQSKSECDSNQSALRYSASWAEGSNNNAIEADNICAEVPEVPPGPDEPSEDELRKKELQANIERLKYSVI